MFRVIVLQKCQIISLLIITNFLVSVWTVESRSISENDAINTRNDPSRVGKVLYVTDDDGNKIPVITTPALRNDMTRNIDSAKIEDFSRTTSFMLFTKSNSKEYELLNVDDEDALFKSSFNPELPTKIITHGWTATNTTKSCTLVRDGESTSSSNTKH